MDIQILNPQIILNPHVVAIAEYIKMYAGSVAYGGFVIGSTYLGFDVARRVVDIAGTYFKTRASGFSKKLESDIDRLGKKVEGLENKLNQSNEHKPSAQ